MGFPFLTAAVLECVLSPRRHDPDPAPLPPELLTPTPPIASFETPIIDDNPPATACLRSHRGFFSASFLILEDDKATRARVEP